MTNGRMESITYGVNNILIFVVVVVAFVVVVVVVVAYIWSQ